MNSKLIRKDNEDIALLFKRIDLLTEKMNAYPEMDKLMLGEDSFLTDKELSAKLKISRRSLQDYRNEGRIPFIQFGGKILYREADIEEVLRNGYRKAYRLDME